MNKINFFHYSEYLEIFYYFFISHDSRIHADSCDRLWVLDTGTIGIGNTTVQACPYTLNVFDLTTDKLIRQYKLRPEDINQVRL